MTLDLESLKRAAEGATPGPHEVGYDNDTGPDDESFWEWWSAGTGKFSNEADAKFYALANPSSILALIARIEASERDGERYRWLRKWRQVLLLTGFFGNGCVNRTIEEVDVAIDAQIAARKE